MPIARRSLQVPLHCKYGTIDAMIDCGASGIFIDSQVVQDLNIPTKNITPIRVDNVDGTENTAGRISQIVELSFSFYGREMNAVFMVTTLGKQAIILGLPWLEAENPDINWRKRTLRWRNAESRNIYVMMRPTYEPIDDLLISFIKREATDEARMTWNETRMNKSQLFAFKKEEKKPKKSTEEMVPKELHKYLSIFGEGESNRLPKHTEYDHRIDLKEGFEPKRAKVYRLHPENEKAFNDFIDENLAKGYIRPSDSPQASGFFFVPKKDGRVRPCQDYRYLNDWTVKNAYPLPRIDELVDSLAGMKLFTKMDVRWGYNNVRIREGDEWKAAFICKRGLFEPTVMFFGLCNSPATFQSMMDSIFKVQIAQSVLKGYIDDMLIPTTGDRDELTQNTLTICQLLEENDLFIKPEKCVFYTTTVEFLGFIIDNGTIKMDSTKVQGILDWPAPTTLTQLRSFIGFCNFYRRFISHYSDLCAPLNGLLRKNQPWNWEKEQQIAFETLKGMYAKEPVLLAPDYSKPFRIECDASQVAVGGVLLQDDTNGDEHPVAYFSKAHTPPERNYMTHDQEFLAIILCVRQWRHFLIGSPHTTIIYTDHQNLTYFQEANKLTRRQARWTAELMEYDFKLQHKKGKRMVVADALSRRADYASLGKTDNENIVALPESLWINLLDTELRDAIVRGQLQDVFAQDAISKLNDPSSPSLGNWTAVKNPDDSLTLFNDGRIYVPDNLQLRRMIVADHHDTPIAGHPGIQATVRSVRSSYFWPGLQQFVRNYVNGCAICQQFKISTRPTKPSLYPIPSGSNRLFGSIGIDFMTDLPESDAFDSIMLVVDHGLSKGIIIIPCSKKGLTAEQTATLFINNVYSRFGLPDKLMTDRGTQFDAEFFRDLCKQLGIKPSMTTAFHPQANGGTERVNREIQLYLSIFCINHPTSWSQAIKKAEFSYNNRPHADRAQSPFELMYGQAPKAIPEPFAHSEYPTVEARLQQLDQWRKDALIAHEYARERMKKRIQENYKPFALGQKVWLEGRNLKLDYNKKITTKREGPFEIIEVLKPVNYRLRLPEGWRIHNVFHANLLTPYRENPIHGPNFTQPPPDLVDDHEEWEVERILRHKGTKNKTYMVKWKGYDSPTWEPEENLTHASDIVADYWNRIKKKTRRR